MSAAEILAAAAEVAARQPTLDKAVRAGWSACHADRDLIGDVFAAWARSEELASHPSDLGRLLRHRYATPQEIADSLRRAAEGAAL